MWIVWFFLLCQICVNGVELVVDPKCCLKWIVWLLLLVLDKAHSLNTLWLAMISGPPNHNMGCVCQTSKSAIGLGTINLLLDCSSYLGTWGMDSLLIDNAHLFCEQWSEFCHGSCESIRPIQWLGRNREGVPTNHWHKTGWLYQCLESLSPCIHVCFPGMHNIGILLEVCQQNTLAPPQKWGAALNLPQLTPLSRCASELQTTNSLSTSSA